MFLILGNLYGAL